MIEQKKVLLSKYKNNLSILNRFTRLIWNVIYILLFHSLFLKQLNFFRILILRLFGAKIGRNCYVASNVRIWAPWNLKMHDYTLLAENVRCYNVDVVEIFSQTVVSENAYLCTASHDISNVNHPLITFPIILKDQVWVASDVFIGMGVTVGQGAVVGARACVFKDVEPWTVVGGNPAKFIKKRILKN